MNVDFSNWTCEHPEIYHPGKSKDCFNIGDCYYFISEDNNASETGDVLRNGADSFNDAHYHVNLGKVVTFISAQNMEIEMENEFRKSIRAINNPNLARSYLANLAKLTGIAIDYIPPKEHGQQLQEAFLKHRSANMFINNSDNDCALLKYLHAYYPYWLNRTRRIPNPYHNSASMDILMLKKRYPNQVRHYGKQIAAMLKNSDFAVVVVPSHSPSVLSSGIKDVAKYLLAKHRNIIDATDTLVRFKPVPRQALERCRTEQTHLTSIRVENLKHIKGKQILLMDDVYTTGSTMNACRKLLMDAGAQKVKCLALAKTFRKCS